jgi:GMP synthase-like glutamine amidotransferase
MRDSAARPTILFVDILNHPTVQFTSEYHQTLEQASAGQARIEMCRLSEVSFDDIDRRDVAGVILSGSVSPYCSADRWVAQVAGFLRHAFQCPRVQVLGLCMVHELIASMFGGLVLPGRRKELGVVRLTKTAAGERSPLLAGLPGTFELLAAHSRDVVVPPLGATILASNARTECQMFEYGNLYGIQSHPEVSASALRHWLMTREGMQGLLQQGFIADESELESFLDAQVRECPARYRVFANFIEIALRAAAPQAGPE